MAITITPAERLRIRAHVSAAHAETCGQTSVTVSNLAIVDAALRELGINVAEPTLPAHVFARRAAQAPASASDGERVELIRARAEDAAIRGDMLIEGAGRHYVLVGEYDDAVTARAYTEEAAAFIAQAWSDVPWLLARLAEQATAIREQVAHEIEALGLVITDGQGDDRPIAASVIRSAAARIARGNQ